MDKLFLNKIWLKYIVSTQRVLLNNDTHKTLVKIFVKLFNGSRNCGKMLSHTIRRWVRGWVIFHYNYLSLYCFAKLFCLCQFFSVNSMNHLSFSGILLFLEMNIAILSHELSCFEIWEHLPVQIVMKFFNLWQLNMSTWLSPSVTNENNEWTRGWLFIKVWINKNFNDASNNDKSSTRYRSKV